MDAFIGEIRAFANTYYPNGWLPCNGQQVSIRDNQALYTIIGGTYGDTDYQTYFTIPDLRGTAIIGSGQNPQGTLDLNLGEKAGTETVVLTADNLPIHTHAPIGATGTDTTQMIATPDSEGSSFLSNVGYKNATGVQVGTPGFVPQPVSPVTLHPNTITPVGGNTQTTCVPHYNMAPYVAINYYICTFDGTYPQRP